MTQELVQAPELTAAVQDYAKAIYALETRDGTATTNALAERLDVRPASVSGMLKKLAVLVLVESLGMSWDEVHAEAEVLEHVLSEGLEELIAAKLGDPTLDPHGDPIPSRELTIADDESGALYDLEPGRLATFVRVSDDPEMLRFLAERGIAPGARLEVVERQPFDGPLYVRSGDEVHVLGATLARAMRVSEDE